MASRVTVGPNALGDAMMSALESYGDEVTREVNAASKRVAADLVRATRATAPRGHRARGAYRASISSKLLRRSPAGDTYVWYVRKPNYRLSHLLERGHKKVGGVGKTRAFRFIEPARDAAAREYERQVREAIGRASR